MVTAPLNAAGPAAAISRKSHLAPLQGAGIEQKQLSKEFVRQWLISEGFQGLEGQLIPHMSAELVENVSNRYIELYESITGQKFIKRDYSTIESDIEESVNKFISSN